MKYRTMRTCNLILLIITLTRSHQCSGIFVNETAQPENVLHEFEDAGHFVSASENQFNVQERTGPDPKEASMTTVEIIVNRGYPVEIHDVTSSDGYILELHRIPYGKGSKMASNVPRRPVFLQHGLLNSDNVWLILPDALAFVLADKGYDVWLGNARGNTYSRRHVSLDPANQNYWNFSFDEMGNYDIPAVIDFVLAQTKMQKMSYIGHSMGCAMFFICMSLHPELNEKVDVMIALAPAVSMGKTTAPLMLSQGPIAEQVKFFLNVFGLRAYQPVDSPWNNLRKRYCGPNLFLRHSLCQNTLFATTGDEYYTIDVNLLPIIDGHNPAGTSINTAVQYAQNYMAGQTFQRYDFGRRENQLRYHQSTPPIYNLAKVTCDVFILWGQNDKTADPDDIAWLETKLGNLKASIMIEDPQWNHLAFSFSTEAKRLVYDKLIPFLPQPNL